MVYNKIVLNVPHSSNEGVFDKQFCGWETNEKFEKECVQKWTDWHTNIVFKPIEHLKEYIEMHVFPLSRFIIDAERLENDPLKTKGQGILYTDFEGFHREIAPEVRDSLMNIYHKYIQQIRNSLAHNAILVDCHSFPQGLSDVDVCIGFNEDWSKPEQQTIDIIAKKFYKAGYKVGINNPYSNSLSPTCDFTYHSLMIEVNKRIYIDSVNHHLLPDADKFTRTINEIYAFLLHQESNRIKKLMELSIKKAPSH